MISENAIRQQIIAYLKRSISLDELEDWIVEKSWNMHKDSDSAAIELAIATEAVLMEYSDSSSMTEAALREKLFREISNVVSSVRSSLVYGVTASMPITPPREIG